MEQVKKRLAQLKEEKEAALEKYEEAEKARKEAEDRADQVRHSYGFGLYFMGNYIVYHFAELAASFCGKIYMRR